MTTSKTTAFVPLRWGQEQTDRRNTGFETPPPSQLTISCIMRLASLFLKAMISPSQMPSPSGSLLSSPQPKRVREVAPPFVLALPPMSCILVMGGPSCFLLYFDPVQQMFVEVTAYI